MIQLLVSLFFIILFHFKSLKSLNVHICECYTVFCFKRLVIQTIVRDGTSVFCWLVGCIGV